MCTIPRALDHLLRAVGDPIRDLDHIGPGHPAHLDAEVIRAAVGVLAKVPTSLPAVARAIREADGPGVPPRLKAHFGAARAWLHGDAADAARRYADILGHWPCDLLAVRLAQSCYFFLGEPERSCELVDEVMKAWRPDAEKFGYMLAMASFAHAEAGHASRAEQLGRDALTRDPACPLGVHALAHAMVHSGQPRAGSRWMREQREHWAVPSRMRTHNAWHLAMFDVDNGETSSALGILDTCLMASAQTSPVDACDATILLGRLAGMGIDLGERWLGLSNGFERTWQPGFWPYVDLHAVATHLQAGRRARAERLIRSVELCATGDHPSAIRAREITVPILRMLSAPIGEDRIAVSTLRSVPRQSTPPVEVVSRRRASPNLINDIVQRRSSDSQNRARMVAQARLVEAYERADETLAFIERGQLQDSGCGAIDLLLLGSVLLTSDAVLR